MSDEAVLPHNLDPKLLGARLQEARKEAGLTQMAAADRMRMARTTVLAIESGTRRVTAAELEEFAELYGRTASEIVSRRVPMNSIVPLLRAAESGLLEQHTDVEKAALEFQRLSEDYAELEYLTGAPTQRTYPPPYDVSSASIEQAAAYVASAERNRLGLGDGPVGNLRELLETDLGLRVFCLAMPASVAGIYACNEPLGACIAINLTYASDRRNWILAHEFGHFLMHRLRAEITVLEVGRRGDPAERQAVGFAEQFLMPAPGLERRFIELAMSRPEGANLVDLVSLAGLYSVPVQALVVRLERLRRLRAGTWERMKAGGMKYDAGASREPAAAAEEKLPRRYVALAVDAFRRDALSEDQLARYLRTDRRAARRAVAEAQARIYSGEGE